MANQPKGNTPAQMQVTDSNAPVRSSGTGASSSSTSSSGAASSERDELKFILALYEDLGTLPRKDYIRKFANIASVIENIDNPALHLWQLEELINQYLATPVPIQPTETPSTPAAASPSTAVASGSSTDVPILPSLIFHNVEFTNYFLDTVLPAIVRNLLGRSYNSITSLRTSLSSATASSLLNDDADQTIIPRVNAFLQAVMKVVVKHLKEPTKPVTMTLPAPASTAPTTSAPAAASSAPATPSPPTYVTAPVGPLFPDSICSNLMTALQRIFDRERQFYYFHDRGGRGRDDEDGEDLDLSDDDDDEETEKLQERALASLSADVIQRMHGMTVDEYRASLASQRKARQEARERERAAKIDAKINAQRRIEEQRPKVLYSSASPGMAAHGWLQRNIQFFGEIGGFDLIATRFSYGINTKLDARVPVASRRGLNPAQGARGPFYRKELSRRKAWAKSCAANGTFYAVDPPPPPSGSFPSIAPYLMPNVFVDPLTTTPNNAPVPLHRVRYLLDPLLKIWNLLDKTYWVAMGSQIKDALIVRLLHIRPEESRLCDKEYLQNILQDYLWKMIKYLSVTHIGDWKAVAWPILDEESDKLWKLERKKIKEEKEAEEAANEAAEEQEDETDAASPSATSPPIVIYPSSEPPVLYELNYNADECMECITIYLSYQLFCSSLLEKRINGLSDINRMVELTLVRERLENPPENGVNRDANGERIVVTAWLNMEVLSNYLMQIQIIDELYGEYVPPGAEEANPSREKSTHPQLIQRCDEIVKFLARLDRLTVTHLRQIWSASIGKHETIVQSIYALLGNCVRALKLEHIELIIDEFLPSIPLESWSEPTLRLVASMMDGGEDEDEEKTIVEKGVALLWKVLMMPQSVLEDSSLISPSVASSSSTSSTTPASTAAFPRAKTKLGANVSFALKQQCVFQMHHMLQKTTMEPLRRQYIHRILTLLRSKDASSFKSRGMLLWLLPCLLDCYTNARPQSEELQKWSVIGNLISKDKLLVLLLEDLGLFTAQAQTNWKKIQDNTANSNAQKKSKRAIKLPDPTLLVLTETCDATTTASSTIATSASKENELACLGVNLLELNNNITLPASMDLSGELLSALKKSHSTLNCSDATAVNTAVIPPPTAAASTAGASATAALPRSTDAFSYELEVLIRLELIRFILVHSFQTLNSSQVDTLWKSAVTQSVSERGRQQFFMWLRTLHSPKPVQVPLLIHSQQAAAQAAAAAAGSSKISSTFIDTTRYFKIFSDESVLHLFNKHLSNPADLDWNTIDECGFTCWRHFFLVLNESQKHIILFAPLTTITASSALLSGFNPAVLNAAGGGTTSITPIQFRVHASAFQAGSGLIGLEHLWNICLHAQQTKVVSLAVDVLVQAYVCPSSNTTPTTSAGVAPLEDAEWVFTAREKFVARCMEFMKNAASTTTDNSQSSASSSSSSSRILRCLSLLQSFMAVCPDSGEAEEHAAAESAHGAPSRSANAGGDLTYQIHVGSVVPQSNEIMTQSIPQGQTVRDAKNQLSYLLNIPTFKMGLFSPALKRELLNFELLTSKNTQGVLELTPPTNRSNIQHPENDVPFEGVGHEANVEETEEDLAALSLSRSFTPATSDHAATLLHSKNPTQLLTNQQQYFDLLFALLSSGSSSATQSEISTRVWKLLTSLPTNMRLLDEMKSLQCVSRATATSAAEGVNAWSNLLDIRSPFKLLYSLRIISKLAAARLPLSHASQAASMHSNQAFARGVDWRQKFVRLGGVENLYTILLQLLEQRAAATTKPATGSSSDIQWDDSRNACLSLTLKLFNFFLLCSQAHSNHCMHYLLPEVLPELAATAGSKEESGALPQHSALRLLLQSSAQSAAFLDTISFSNLTKEALRLLDSSAKAASKSYRATLHAGSHPHHTRAVSSISGAKGLHIATPAKVKPTVSPASPPPPSAASSSHAPTSQLEQADGGANSDEYLIKQSLLLLSLCVLHQKPQIDEISTEASPAAPAAEAETPVSILTATGSSPTYSTLLFLCSPSVSYDATESFLQLCQRFESPAHVAQPAAPMALHRFFVQDVLLKCLPTLVGSNTRYASASLDFFQLLELLLRDILNFELYSSASISVLQKPFSWKSFFLRICSFMRSRPILESNKQPSAATNASTTRSSSASSSKLAEGSCDFVLVGLMNIASTLLSHIPALRELIAERPRAHSVEMEEIMAELSLQPPTSASNGPATTTPGRASPTGAALHNAAAGLVHEVFMWLFELPSLQTAHLPLQAPKAKTRITRLAAFNLLLSMCENHPSNFYHLSSLLFEQNICNNSVRMSNDWEYSPEDYTKSSTGYVGLQNLSSTCYLNSMMQQLYMIPEFRHKLLSINIPSANQPAGKEQRSGSPTQESKSALTSSPNGSNAANNDLMENLLYQMQYMFGYLEASSKKAFNTTGFCKAFKDYEGKSIDIRVQQDVDEFFNALCDRLEGALKSNSDALKAVMGSPLVFNPNLELVKETFGGELEHQLLCQDCPHTSFRSEPFFALPLNVKNKSSIAASLENFIQGEMLEGENSYMCHTCKKKVRTFKRVCIKTLPNILVLNLKRFEFNFDEMIKVKLNDLVSFPMEGLQMEPYTAEGLAKIENEKKNKAGTDSTAPAASDTATSEEQKSEAKESDAASSVLPAIAPSLQVSSSQVTATPSTYTLVGVLLHSGGSESGHYTSLVRERIPGQSSGAGTRWLEFNDSVVREFDPANLDVECFGGTQVLSIWDSKLRRKVTKEVERTRSAYLLIYERDQPARVNADQQTPIQSPVKRPSSAMADRPLFPFSPDSPKTSAEPTATSSGLSSPIRSSSSRAKTPVDVAPLGAGRRSPNNASPPPPPHMSRSNSAGLGGTRTNKRLEFGGGSPTNVDDEPAITGLDSSEPPIFSPSLSRFPSSTEQLSTPRPMSSGGSSAPCIPATMPPQIYQSIWEENLGFLKNRQLFQRDYFNFIVAFLNLAPPPEDGPPLPRMVDGLIDPSELRARRMDYGLPSQLGCEEEVRHIQLATVFLTDVIAHAKYMTNPGSYERDREKSGEDAEHLIVNVRERHRAFGGRSGLEHRARMRIESSSPAHVLLPAYRTLLLRFFSNHIPAACWCINEHLLGRSYMLRYFLFDCSSEFMRDYLSDIFALVLAVLVPVERPLYEKMERFEVNTQLGPSSSIGDGRAGAGGVQVIHIPSAFSLQFIDQLMLLWKDLAFNWKCLSPYFAILHSFADLGYNERLYLLHTHNIIVCIIDLYLGDMSPYARNDKYMSTKPRPKMGDADMSPNYFTMFALLSLAIRSGLETTNPEAILVLPPTLLTVKDGSLPLLVGAVNAATAGQSSSEATDGKGGDAVSPASADATTESASDETTEAGASSRASTPSNAGAPSSLVLTVPPDSDLTIPYHLFHTHSYSSSELNMMLNPIFLKQFMKDGWNIDANKEILAHLCYDNDETDSRIANQLLKLIEDANYDSLEPLFALVPPLLSMKDSIQPRRIARYLHPQTGLASRAYKFHNTYPLYCYYMLKFIFLTVGAMEGPVKEFMIKNRASLYWGYGWMVHHHERTLTRAQTAHTIKDMPVPLPASATSSTVSSPPQLRRQVSTYDTVAAIADWFGPDYLAERAEAERVAAEQRRTAQATAGAAAGASAAARSKVPIRSLRSAAAESVAAGVPHSSAAMLQRQQEYQMQQDRLQNPNFDDDEEIDSDDASGDAAVQDMDDMDAQDDDGVGRGATGSRFQGDEDGDDDSQNNHALSDDDDDDGDNDRNVIIRGSQVKYHGEKRGGGMELLDDGESPDADVTDDVVDGDDGDNGDDAFDDDYTAEVKRLDRLLSSKSIGIPQIVAQAPSFKYKHDRLIQLVRDYNASLQQKQATNPQSNNLQIKGMAMSVGNSSNSSGSKPAGIQSVPIARGSPQYNDDEAAVTDVDEHDENSRNSTSRFSLASAPGSDDDAGFVDANDVDVDHLNSDDDNGSGTNVQRNINYPIMNDSNDAYFFSDDEDPVEAVARYERQQAEAAERAAKLKK